MLKNLFYYKTTNKLKNYIGFFNLFNNCLIQSFIFKYDSYSIIDIAFKYTISISNYADNYIEHCNNKILKILNFQTKNNQIMIAWKNINKFLYSKLYESILKKALKNRFFLSGKILNFTRKFFAVGILGFVCLLPKKKALIKEIGISSLFIINKFERVRKTYFLSQKQVLKLISKILIKVFSTISYISKN